MEQTFMTIHNLSPDANILFVSESIVDILGYQPQDVQGKSCFDYFHPEEVPFARSVHSRGVLLDKAAVLHYARIMSRDGQWVSCECCFTIVHDVLVACTSIYRRGERSKRRAIEAPQIRRIFSSSPRDPRYHMLEHLSPKFKMQPMEREPRAALILNRFTRTLTVMFATNAVASILGVRPDQVKDKSFYECIAENCLADAIKCLESAKANDSIAYLRFWYRDPRRDEDFEEDEEAEEEDDEEDEIEQEQDGDIIDDDSRSSDSCVHAGNAMDVDIDGTPDLEIKTEAIISPELSKAAVLDRKPRGLITPPSSLPETGTYQTPEDTCHQAQNSARRADGRRSRRRNTIPTFELEAVVSCTSDGLVVVLRKARPPIPSLHPPLLPVDFENGLFAAPWSEQPIKPYYPPEHFYTFRPPLLPQYMPLREHVKTAGGPPIDQLMKSIRDVAVFAWAVVGINGNLAAYGRGVPRENSQPQDGLPSCDPKAPKASYRALESQPPQQWGASSSEGRLTDTNVPPNPRYVSNINPEALQGRYGSTPAELNGGSPGFSNPPAWPHSRPLAPTYEHWPSHAQGPQQSQSLSGFNQHFTEPWVEASASYAQHNANHYAIPTTQVHGFRDNSRSYRSMWK
ncbi:hypothetical protein F4804DRAFT_56292 [Jackrogersella minutella]|nr:hypothetical protein F4804DRAFT_56292 [Jackrogersella minutella]